MQRGFAENMEEQEVIRGASRKPCIGFNPPDLSESFQDGVSVSSAAAQSKPASLCTLTCV